MAYNLYTVHLTGEQLESVADLFKAKGWSLNLDENGSRYLALKEVADEYVDVAKANGNETTYQNMLIGGDETSKKNGSTSKAMAIFTNRLIDDVTAASPATDRFQKSFKTMKQTANNYKTLRASMKANSAAVKTTDEDESGEIPKNTRKGTWRLSTWDPEFKGHVKSEISLQHFCVAEGDILKVVTSLSSTHIHQVCRVPIRIVLLVDRSGSMLNKLGKGGIYSKITMVKRFARQLVTSLDDGDEAAVVTFGNEAEIFFPLTKLTADSRPYLMEMLNKLDKGGMSQQTNLSAGLRMSLKAFYDSTKDKADYLSVKNSIIVFSDGEINAGTIPAESLVHEVRQNIRQMVPSIDNSQNQWVTISVITTGNAVSEQAYLLSKNCSSDAFYYIDKEAEDPEAELFIPVLLRKTAVAWNISVIIEVFQDILFVDKQCTHDFRIRLRRSFSGNERKTEKAYFLYDFPAGHKRQIGVCVDLSGLPALENLSEDEMLFKIRVEYSNINGERLWQEKIITVSDLITAKANPGTAAAQNAVHKHDLRIVSTSVFHSAAEHVRDGEYMKSKDVLEDGQRDIKAMLDKFGADAQTADSQPNTEFTMYAKSVVDNLGALIDCIESATDTGTWNKIKAISTAIARETPNSTDIVKDGDILCPLPVIEQMETKEMTNAMENLVVKQAKQKRVTLGD